MRKIVATFYFHCLEWARNGNGDEASVATIECSNQFAHIQQFLSNANLTLYLSYLPCYRCQRQESSCPQRLSPLEGEDGGEGEEGEERLRVGRGEEDGRRVHAEQQSGLKTGCRKDCLRGQGSQGHLPCLIDLE